MKHSATGSQTEWGETRARGKDGETVGGFTVSPPSLAEVTVMEGVEMGKEEGREEKASPLSEEEDERSSADEEAPESHCDSEEESGSVKGDEERLEGEGKQGTPPPLSTEEDRGRPSR